jgi:hypothetical protein
MAMNHLHLTYDQIMDMPFAMINLCLTESIPRSRKPKSNEVELDTYWGKVKATKKFII